MGECSGVHPERNETWMTELPLPEERPPDEVNVTRGRRLRPTTNAVGLALLLVAAFAPTSPNAAGGVRPPVMSFARFWDNHRGIALFGVCSKTRCESQLRRTDDGGRNWRYTRQLTEADSTLVLAAPDNVWAGRLASADGGGTWRQQPRTRFAPIAMADGSTGWGIDATRAQALGGQPQRLARTTNGGRAWQVVKNPCERVGDMLVDVSAPTRSQAWVLCDAMYGLGNDAKAVFMTTDSGQRWHLVNQTDFPGAGRRLVGHGLTPAGYAAGITFHANGHGWLWEDRGTVYATEDAGRNWHPIHLPWQAAEPESVSFPTDQTGFIVMRVYPTHGPFSFSYRLARTNDGSHTWKTIRKWQP